MWKNWNLYTLLVRMNVNGSAALRTVWWFVTKLNIELPYFHWEGAGPRWVCPGTVWDIQVLDFVQERFFFNSLMYVNSKLTGTARKTDNIKNIRACRTTQLGKYSEWMESTVR